MPTEPLSTRLDAWTSANARTDTRSSPRETTETYVDQTQWNFQNEKKRLRAAGELPTGRYAAGFIRGGVWAWSRHPNYLAEQSLWIVYFLFSVAAKHRVSWTIGGCLLLVGLFQGSSWLSESI